MLSSKMVRVKHSRNKLLPQDIEVDDRQWQDVAERLVMLFRSFQGASRDEVEEEVTETLGDNPTQFVHQGL